MVERVTQAQLTCEDEIFELYPECSCGMRNSPIHVCLSNCYKKDPYFCGYCANRKPKKHKCRLHLRAVVCHSKLEKCRVVMDELQSLFQKAKSLYDKNYEAIQVLENAAFISVGQKGRLSVEQDFQNLQALFEESVKLYTEAAILSRAFDAVTMIERVATRKSIQNRIHPLVYLGELQQAKVFDIYYNYIDLISPQSAEQLSEPSKTMLIELIERGAAITETISEQPQNNDIKEVQKVFNKKILKMSTEYLVQGLNLKRENQELKSQMQKLMDEHKCSVMEEVKTSLVQKDSAIDQLQNQVSTIQTQLNQLWAINQLRKYRKSTILTTDSQRDFVNNLIPSEKVTLLFRASRDGWTAANFHQNCDNQGRTMVIVKSTGNKVFGGYAAAPWDQTSNWDDGMDHFLFSYDNQAKYIRKQGGNGILRNDGCGPTFGNDHDLHLNETMNNNNNYSSIGKGYVLPPDTDGTTILTGGYNFQCSEVEVYRLD